VRLVTISLLAVFAVAAAGCGAVATITSGNPAEGKQLFIAKCGVCHTLANAKTTGAVGPNLDDAFAADKQQGFHISTITDVVRGQIAYAESNPGTGQPGMTPNLYTGQDAKDVSVYVAICSAHPTCDTPNTNVNVKTYPTG
jgi:mono/diheme cytochrome c family protein